MAIYAYLRLKSSTQGNIKGDVTDTGWEKSIRVISFAHGLSVQRDAATGMPMSKRQHQVLTICKDIDISTPPLLSAMINNENLPEWTLTFRKTNSAGIVTPFYVIDLINAYITNISQSMLDVTDDENEMKNERENISFIYEKIIWTILDGGICSEDDWENPAPEQVILPGKVLPLAKKPSVILKSPKRGR